MKKSVLVVLGFALIGSAACSSSSTKSSDGSTTTGSGDALSADSAPRSDGSSAATDSGATGDARDAAATTDGAAATDSAADSAAADKAPSDVAAADVAPAVDTASSTDTGAADVALTAACPLPAALPTVCNAQQNVGLPVVLAPVATDVPTGTGGTMVDGRYVLTSFVGYPGNPLIVGQTMRQTLVLCGGTGQFVEGLTGAAPTFKNFSITTSGTAPTITTLCTSMADTNIPYASYTATATTVSFYSTVFKFSVTYTKQ